MISCYSLSHINTVPDQTYFFQSLKKNQSMDIDYRIIDHSELKYSQFLSHFIF